MRIKFKLTNFSLQWIKELISWKILIRKIWAEMNFRWVIQCCVYCNILNVNSSTISRLTAVESLGAIRASFHWRIIKIKFNTKRRDRENFISSDIQQIPNQGLPSSDHLKVFENSKNYSVLLREMKNYLYWDT